VTGATSNGAAAALEVVRLREEIEGLKEILESARVWIMTAHVEPGPQDLSSGVRSLRPTLEGWTLHRAAIAERIDAALAGARSRPIPAEPMVPVDSEPKICVERARQYTAAAKGYVEMIARAEDGAEQRDLIGRALAALDKHEALCRAEVAKFRAEPVWKHHRGGRYRVVGHCLFQIKGSPLDGAQGVVYAALENPSLPLFVRPMDEWADEVAPGVLRFVPVAASAPTTCSGGLPYTQ